MFLDSGKLRFTATKKAGALTRHAAAAALSERPIMNYHVKPKTIREALEALIYYAEQASPDMPDTARVENLAISIELAREALKGYE